VTLEVEVLGPVGGGDFAAEGHADGFGIGDNPEATKEEPGRIEAVAVQDDHDDGGDREPFCGAVDTGARGRVDRKQGHGEEDRGENRSDDRNAGDENGRGGGVRRKCPGDGGKCVGRGRADRGDDGNGDEETLAERRGAEELRFAAAAAELACFCASNEDAAILAVGGFGVAESGERGAIGFVGG